MYIQSSTYKRGLPELGVSRVAEDYDIVRLRYDRRALCLPLSTILGLSFKNQVIAVVAAARDPAFPSPSPSFPFAAGNEEKMGDILSRREMPKFHRTPPIQNLCFMLNKCEIQFGQLVRNRLAKSLERINFPLELYYTCVKFIISLNV